MLNNICLLRLIVQVEDEFVSNTLENFELMGYVNLSELYTHTNCVALIKNNE